MKHIFLTVLAAVLALTFASCDKTDDNPDHVVFPTNELFRQTYTIDGNGCCVLKSAKPLTAADVESKVTGYGWQPVGTFEVKDNGRLSTTDYYEDFIGSGPTAYWFESSTRLTAYFGIDAVPARAYSRRSWSYDTGRGFVMQDYNNSESSEDVNRYMQIIDVIDHEGKTYMYTIQKIAVKKSEVQHKRQSAEAAAGRANHLQANDQDEWKPVFVMTVYQRMTDSELEKKKATYTYDADKDRKFRLTMPTAYKEDMNSRYYVRAEPLAAQSEK